MVKGELSEVMRSKGNLPDLNGGNFPLEKGAFWGYLKFEEKGGTVPPALQGIAAFDKDTTTASAVNHINNIYRFHDNDDYKNIYNNIHKNNNNSNDNNENTSIASTTSTSYLYY